MLCRIWLLLLLLCIKLSFAQEKISIAVLGILPNSVFPEDANKIEKYIETALETRADYDILSRDQIDLVFYQYDISRTEFDSDKKCIAAGKLLNVRLAVAGEYAYAGTKKSAQEQKYKLHRLTLKLFDIPNESIINSVLTEINLTKDTPLDSLVAAAVNQLMPAGFGSAVENNPAPDGGYYGQEYVNQARELELVGGDKAIYDYIQKKNLYPAKAKAEKVEGAAIIQYTVGAEGKAKSISIWYEHPKGYGFGDAGVKAIKAMTFTPASDEYGNPKEVQLQQTIRFRLK